MTDDRRQMTEDRGQKTEDRGQKTEDRGQKAEDRGQEAEDRGQKTEGRSLEEGIRNWACDELHSASSGLEPVESSRFECGSWNALANNL